MYDVSKKHAVNGNPVMPVLFLSTLCGTILVTIVSLTRFGLGFASCTLHDYLLILVKACIVSSSWMTGYYGVRELPISISSTVAATLPLWTVCGGILIYSEIPNGWQIAGMAIIFAGYFMIYGCCKFDGICWYGKGMILMLASNLFNSISGLYDKFLINRQGISPTLVQFYFSLTMLPIFATMGFVLREKKPLQFRWSIPATGIFLIFADMLYFYSLTFPDAPISVLSMIRRSNVIFAFFIGYLLFKDRNIIKKSYALAMILIGAFLLLAFR